MIKFLVLEGKSAKRISWRSVKRLAKKASAKQQFLHGAVIFAKRRNFVDWGIITFSIVFPSSSK